MTMIYISRNLLASLSFPWRSLSLFFVAPLIFLATDHSISTQIMVLDAILGVGLIAVIFLLSFRKWKMLNLALMFAMIGIMLYAGLRSQLYGDYLFKLFESTRESVEAQLPAMVNQEYLQLSLSLWRNIMPASWGLGQILALFLGYIFFHRGLGASFRFGSLRFPAAYNLLIVGILPIYLLPAGKYFFINALLLLCTVPFLQGLALVTTYLARVFSNGIIRGIIMFFIMIYAFIPLTLIGFADSWLSLQKTNSGGNTA